MTDQKDSTPGPLTERMARAVLANEEEYSEEERDRVRDALDNRPGELGRVLKEIHRTHGDGEGEG